MMEIDSVSDYEYACETPITNQPLKKHDYIVYTRDDLIRKQQDEVWNVHEVLNVPVSVAGSLLRYMQWDKEKLYGPFFEDPDRLCKKAGVSLDSKTVIKAKSGENTTCSICYDDNNDSSSVALKCRHWFCRVCWKSYLHAKIEDGPSCLMSHCPFAKCNMKVDEALVQEFADPNDFKKYGKFLARSFVDDNPHIKWCPAPNCDRAVYCPDLTQSVVQCACGNKFCFKCGFEAHAPCACAQLKEWIKKEKDESETANWLAVNTKDCPKCNTAIEKNGGCNHMTCSKCRHEWCWVCRDDWAKHGSQTGGYYQCNRYSPSQNDERNKENARAALERYMHYYHRYANHDRSKRFESQLRLKADEKMHELQQINKFSSWIDVEYISQAVEQLIECRRTLKYTYVFAFYMKQGKEKELFEYLQEDLEKVTEKLSEILEAPTDKFDRDEIIRTTRSAERRLSNLLEGVENGLTTS